MAVDTQVMDFAKQIVLAQTGSTDMGKGQTQATMLEEIVMWTNQFLPELETEADWNFSRENNVTIATATTESVYDINDDDIRKLVVNEYRPVTIRQDGSVVSSFKVVNPNNLADPTDHDTGDRATFFNGKLILSRPLYQHEVGGSIVADVIYKLPLLEENDSTLLETVTPVQLLVLGVVKNRILPDIVKGSLNPSYTQKYNALLTQCKMENDATSAVFDLPHESLSFVSGVGF